MLTEPAISIVDDDAFVRDSIGDLLTSLGYRSHTFASSEEFLKSGQVSNTVCLITDLHMPGLNGLDLQAHLLEKGYCMPIIFVTAFADSKAREQALKAGAIAFLSKPFEEDSLIHAVGSALEITSREEAKSPRDHHQIFEPPRCLQGVDTVEKGILR